MTQNITPNNVPRTGSPEAEYCVDKVKSIASKVVKVAICAILCAASFILLPPIFSIFVASIILSSTISSILKSNDQVLIVLQESPPVYSGWWIPWRHRQPVLITPPVIHRSGGLISWFTSLLARAPVGTGAPTRLADHDTTRAPVGTGATTRLADRDTTRASVGTGTPTRLADQNAARAPVGTGAPTRLADQNAARAPGGTGAPRSERRVARPNATASAQQTQEQQPARVPVRARQRS